jgi:hypothetical protein
MKKLRKVLGIEGLEARAMMAADLGMAPAADAMDINADGVVSPVDALQVINSLRHDSLSMRNLAVMDVNGDGAVSSLDALTIVNRLNDGNLREGGLRQRIGDKISEIRDTRAAELGDEATDIREQIQAIREDATRPDRSVGRQLVKEVRAVRADGEVTQDERSTVASHVDALFESANVSNADREELRESIRSLAESRDVDRDDVASRFQNMRSQFQDQAGSRISRVQALRARFGT